LENVRRNTLGLIDVNIYKDSGETSLDFAKALNWLIPFALGLFSALIIEYFKQRQKRKKIRAYLISLLKDQIDPDLPILKEEYQRVKDHINKTNNHYLTVKVFENLNADSFEVTDNAELFSIFKDQFSELCEIKSIVKFIIENLPHLQSDSYFKTVDLHLKEKGVVGNMEHVKTCAFCIQKREILSDNIDKRIKDIETLKGKIDKLLLKYSA